MTQTTGHVDPGLCLSNCVPTPRPVIQRHTHTHIQRTTTTTTTTTNMASLHEIEERTVPESLTLLNVGAGFRTGRLRSLGCGLGFSSRALMTFWTATGEVQKAAGCASLKKVPLPGQNEEKGGEGARSAWTARFEQAGTRRSWQEGQAKAEGTGPEVEEFGVPAASRTGVLAWLAFSRETSAHAHNALCCLTSPPDLLGGAAVWLCSRRGRWSSAWILLLFFLARSSALFCPALPAPRTTFPFRDSTRLDLHERPPALLIGSPSA